jgi:hypothetical protein
MEYCPHCHCFFADDEDPDPLCSCGHPLMCCLDAEFILVDAVRQRHRALDLFGLAESGYSDYELKMLVQKSRNPDAFN